jgi:hypothetical protein
MMKVGKAYSVPPTQERTPKGDKAFELITEDFEMYSRRNWVLFGVNRTGIRKKLEVHFLERILSKFTREEFCLFGK